MQHHDVQHRRSFKFLRQCCVHSSSLATVSTVLLVIDNTHTGTGTRHISLDATRQRTGDSNGPLPSPMHPLQSHLAERSMAAHFQQLVSFSTSAGSHLGVCSHANGNTELRTTGSIENLLCFSLHTARTPPCRACSPQLSTIALCPK